MKRTLRALLWTLPAFAQTQPVGDAFVLRGGTVHTVSGPVIENGAILVRDGKIVAVGKDIPAPEGFQILDITGQHVYPGMIDTAAPELLTAPGALTAARANGVTSAILIPEAGAVSLVHLTDGAATIVPSVAVHVRFPALTTEPIPPRAHDDDTDPAAGATRDPIPYDQAKRDYDDGMRKLRAFFDKARRYRAARRDRILVKDPRYEPMIAVLDGSAPMFFTAIREREIREAIEFADTEQIRIVLTDAYESYKVADLIHTRMIPVVLGPIQSLPLNPDDPYDRSFTTPEELRQAGIRFSIGTFGWKRVPDLPYQAATASAFGLPPDEAYRAVSLRAAEALGAGNRLGSIDEGKIADLIVTDGDPLMVTTHVNLVFIDGKPANANLRQKELFEKYLVKP